MVNPSPTPPSPDDMALRDDPIVIGGIGGTGTRAVAAVLKACGLELVGPSGPELDSQWFTMLIKRPSWPDLVEEATRPVPEIVEALQVLRLMMSGARLGERELAVLAAAAAECAAHGYEDLDGIKWWAPQTPFRFIAQYLAKPPPALTDQVWGWKQPISHVVLPEIIAAFPSVRYIHVVRHPLDMAWSGNTQGVRLWGGLCGVERTSVDASPQNAQLAWWLYSTRQANLVGRQLRERFTMVRLEQLCEHPIGVTRRLAEFSGLSPDEPTLRKAAAQIEPPTSLGMWRERSTDELDQTLLSQVRRWTESWESTPQAGAAPASSGAPSGT